VIFTPWLSLGKKTGFTEHSLAETLEGGQSFLWAKTASGSWLGTWGDNITELRIMSGSLEWRTPKQRTVERKEIVRYLAIDSEYDAICNSLPWRSDPVLADAMKRFRGLRILRQPLSETLFCFLLSSVKSIPQIKDLCLNTAREFGEELVPGIHAIPTWESLAEVAEPDLRALKYGYRAKYVAATAERLAGEPDFFENCLAMPYVDARSKLIELPGVGGKVADCALLFGGAKLEAFPVDTWIAKVMSDRYGMAGWNLDQIASFGRIHFGPYAGLAQQFLFSAVRAG
jgi:N-glycosylase/DNA lyase